ncbi:hypothetical protein V5O48_009882 [Marasmius crinis-equi]|uniref:F-box domain-containing protein n=1 Tax=Marasmius crinis-equi TaxID=585013 RepID=A0ABR3FA21_9AGAR
MSTFQYSSSPFSHVFDTNYAPTSEELNEIYSLLHEPELRARHLAQEISKLQAELDEVQYFIDRHRPLLSPVRRLPADILGEIFVHTLPTNSYNVAGRTLKDAPLLLTTICHSWREIALKTPRLWNRIHIYLPSSHPEFPGDQLFSLIQQRKQGVEMWLERSGALPITFSIAIGSWGAHPEINSHLEDFAALLKKYSRRLRAVKLSPQQTEMGTLISTSVWHSFAELTQEDLPMLQDIQVAGQLFARDWPAETPTPTPLALLLPKLSSLRALSIAHEPVDAFLTLDIQWALLTHLTIKSRRSPTTHASMVVTIARSCPSLLSLSLETELDTEWGNPPFTISPVISSPPPANFRSLTMRLQDMSSADLVSRTLLTTFQSITTPALDDLVIESNFYNSNRQPGSGYMGSHMPFHETLARSNCRITHLTIGDFLLLNIGALSRTLELLDSLVSLTHYHNRNDPDSDCIGPFLRLLTEDTSLCPHLERIHLNCGVTHIDPIITFTTSRHKLRHLRADFGVLNATPTNERVSSEYVKALLVEWRQVRGMQIVWRWQNEIPGFEFYDQPYAGVPNDGQFRPFFESQYMYL